MTALLGRQEHHSLSSVNNLVDSDSEGVWVGDVDCGLIELIDFASDLGALCCQHVANSVVIEDNRCVV